MNKITSRILILAVAFSSLVAVAGMAEARMGNNMNHGNGMGQGMAQNMPTATPEQQAAMQKIFDEHYATVNPLRDQMIAKQTELTAQMNSQTPDAAKIEAISKELGAIRGKMAVEQVNLDSKLDKAGLSAFAGGRMGGMGMMGGQMNGMGGQMGAMNCPMQGGGMGMMGGQGGRMGGMNHGGQHRGGNW